MKKKDNYNTALNGKTGIDCFDDWIKELINYGYLHNHSRMWFASIWIHTLKLPWELGAIFFLKNLVDGDPHLTHSHGVGLPVYIQKENVM